MQDITIKWVNETEIYVKYGDKVYEKIAPIKLLKLYRNDATFMQAYTAFLNQDNLFMISNLQFGNTIFISKKASVLSSPDNSSLKKTSQQDLTIAEKKQLVDDKITNIIKELALSNDNDPYVQLGNICKVQKYIAMASTKSQPPTPANNNYNIDNFFLNELSLGLIKNEHKDITDSIIQREILKRVGIDALVVGLRGNTQNENHSANLIKLYGSYYYFDPTIEGLLYQKSLTNNNPFSLNFAGLGSRTYEKWYKPMVIVSEDIFTTKIPVPSDIAKNSIPSDMIARVMKTKVTDYDII